MVNACVAATGHFLAHDHRTGLLRIADLAGPGAVAVRVGHETCALAPYYLSLAIILRGRDRVYRAPILALLDRPRRSTLRVAQIPQAAHNSYFCDTAGCSRTGRVSYVTADRRVLGLDLVTLATVPEQPQAQPFYLASTTDVVLGPGLHVGSRGRRQGAVLGPAGAVQDLVALRSYAAVFLPATGSPGDARRGALIDLVGNLTTPDSAERLRAPFYFKANASLVRLWGDVLLAYDDRHRRFVALRISVGQ